MMPSKTILSPGNLKNPSILIIDDDDNLRQVVRDVFKTRGYRTIEAGTGKEALRVMMEGDVDIVLLDLKLPDISGLNLFDKLRALDPDVEIIVITAFPGIDTAVSAMKAGAFDYINKPFELEELKIVVVRALEHRLLRDRVTRLERQKRRLFGLDDFIGDHPSISEIKSILPRLAKASNTPVLIHGESGTGKGVLAQVIHHLSARAPNPFIELNCGAVPDTLFESEAFGYEKGAFTGAMGSKKGFVELADKGTLFLDEISESPLPIQPKFLKFLEEHAFYRVGGTREKRVDIRVIAVTNRNIPKLVDQGKFRDDLYFRLKVMEIHIPPLRERGDDVLLLSSYFIQHFRLALGRLVNRISSKTEELFLNYGWPGNVRELKNVIERAMILAEQDVITPDLLPPEFGKTKVIKSELNHISSLDEDLSLKRLENQHIQNVLKLTNGNITQTAKRLGIARSTLKEKFKKYNIKV